MKKIIALCLSLILSLSALSFAFAEDFTIHAGTVFGDKPDDVKSKESLVLTDDMYTILTYTGEVAGYADSEIDYYFDEDTEELKEVRYRILYGEKDRPEKKTEAYNQLQIRLADKYGSPISQNDDAAKFIIPTDLQNLIELNETILKGDQIYNIEMTSWTKSYDGYNVKIDLYLSSRNVEDNNGVKQDQRSCNIVYRYYTDEEIAIAKQAYDISNDDL